MYANLLSAEVVNVIGRTPCYVSTFHVDISHSAVLFPYSVDDKVLFNPVVFFWNIPQYEARVTVAKRVTYYFM